MRFARRVTRLIAVFGCVAAFAAFAPAAHAGSECVEYNDQVVYCIHY